MNWKFIATFLHLAVLASGKMMLVVDDKVVDCDEYSGDKHAKVFDASKVQLIPENDTHTFLNGSITFTREMNMAWGVRIYTEQKVQGDWVQRAFDRKYKDLCVSMDSPLEPFHPYVKDMKHCPFSVGDMWNFNMIAVQLSPALLNAIPSDYIGQWRGTFVGIFNIDGVDKYECKRGFGDLFEE